MFYNLHTVREGRKVNEIRLTPELARLARAYRSAMMDFGDAVLHGKSILKVRISRKIDQLTMRIETVLGRKGLTADQAKDWIAAMEAKMVEKMEEKVS